MLRLLLSLKGWRLLRNAVVLELGHVGAVVAVIAREVCLFVCAAPALLGCVIVSAANLTELPSAGVGFAAEDRGRNVPVLAALVQAGVLGRCCEIDVGHRCVREADVAWRMLVLLLLRRRRRKVDVACRRLVLILLLMLDRCGCEVGAV